MTQSLEKKQKKHLASGPTSRHPGPHVTPLEPNDIRRRRVQVR